MDIADILVDHIYSWLEQIEECAHALAMRALYYRAYELGLATSMGSEYVKMFTMEDVEMISQRISVLEMLIQQLTDLLVKEAEKQDQEALSNADINPETYVVSCILKAMAERSGVKWHDNFLLLENMLHLFKTVSNDTDRFCLLGSSSLSAALLSQIIHKFTTNKVLKQCGTAGGTVASKCLTKLANEVGPTLAVKGVACVGGAAIDLAFAIPQMIDNWKYGSKCNYKTDVTQSLRDTADTLLTTVNEMKCELAGIRNTFRMLANVNCIIDNLGQNAKEDEREELFKFVMNNVKDKCTQGWLKVHSNHGAFLHLVETFHSLKKKIDKEEKTNLSKHIDITFVAHGAIEHPMVPASCLMPLDTIEDVVLYNPWNCKMDADAAYAVAAGRMKPHHRRFTHGKKKHFNQLTKLPNEWNSIKQTGKGQIPNIFVSPLRGPGDRFWERFEYLKNQHGLPQHRFVVPYMKDSYSSAERVPFYIVTLALSLVLIFSRFKATLHLTTCLGRSYKEERIDKAYLERQYACTDDNTTMTVSEAVFYELPWLHMAFKALFQ